VSEVAADVPEHVSVDPLRLRQILGNFLSNAIKFTDRGRIVLKVDTVPEPGHPELVRFAVTDSGIGMDAETIARLCEPFVQGDARTSRRYGGTGLGLAICKRLAGLMSGQLLIESEPGRGSTVSLVLPLPVVRASMPAPTVSSSATHPQLACLLSRAPSVDVAARIGQLILVVDDHPTNRRLLVRQLAWLGYAAEAAENGKHALALFSERRATGTPHSLVITDCQMPEMDGYELTVRIRQFQQHDAARTVILAFTANTLSEAAAECLSVGMDDVLTKPIVLAELRAKLERWLPLRASPEHEDMSADNDATDGLDGNIVGEFCAAHEEDLQLLQAALRERRYESVARAAHRIKGAARMFGDEPLAEAAADLEQLARASGGWEVTDSAARRVQFQTERLFARTGWRQKRHAG
jgi:CheY-like chemotaxis protein